MQAEGFSIRTDNNGIEYITFAKGMRKTRQNRLHENYRLTLPKMFAANSERCPIPIFKFYLSKETLELRNNGPIYMSVIINPSLEI